MPSILLPKVITVPSVPGPIKVDVGPSLKLMTLEDRKSWVEFLRDTTRESSRAYFDPSASFRHIGKFLPAIPAKGYQPEKFVEDILRMAASSDYHSAEGHLTHLTVIYNALIDLLRTPLKGNAHLPVQFDEGPTDTQDIPITVIDEKGDLHWTSNYAPTNLRGLKDPGAVRTEPIMKQLLQRLFRVIHFRLEERTRDSMAKTPKDLANEARKDYQACIKAFNDAVASLEGHADVED